VRTEITLFHYYNRLRRLGEQSRRNSSGLIPLETRDVLDKVQSKYSLYSPNNVQEMRRIKLSYPPRVLEYD